MHLLGDVRLIKNEKLAPLTEQAFKLTKPASLKPASMETTTVVVHESMNESHHC